MQNINLGFTSLKRLLPPTEKKQTKAAILQQAVQHIVRLQGTVVQVRENNNLLRRSLADERKQRFVQAKQLEALLNGKFTKQGFQERGAYHSHAQFKPRPLTPPHEDLNDGSQDRWPPTPCDDEKSSSSEYQMVVFSGCKDSKKREQDSLVKIRCSLWEANGIPERSPNQKLLLGPQEDEPGPSTPTESGESQLCNSGASRHEMRGNNLHCIVDAINLIENR